MKLNEAIEVLKKFKEWANTPTHGSSKYDLIKLFGAIDTVVAELEKPLPSDEQIEAYALENILDGVGIQSMKNTKAWIAGARWMRGLIQERREK